MYECTGVDVAIVHCGADIDGDVVVRCCCLNCSARDFALPKHCCCYRRLYICCILRW